MLNYTLMLFFRQVIHRPGFFKLKKTRFAATGRVPAEGMFFCSGSALAGEGARLLSAASQAYAWVSAAVEAPQNQSGYGRCRFVCFMRMGGGCF